MNSNIHTRSTVARVCPTAILLAFAFAVSGAFAGEPSVQLRSETVRFGDLNVTSPAGVAALYTRIHAAAQRVCAVSGERDFARMSVSADCARKAESGAVQKLSLPALTAYYRIKTGGQVATLAAKR